LRARFCYGVTVAREPARLWVQIRLQQPVEMHDDIFHLGIVNGALSGTAPCFLGRGEILEKAYDIEFAKIFEFKRTRIFDPSAKDQM
jgi:hypothetical protein